MKVIIDTNILLSAVYRGGLPLQAVDFCFRSVSAEIHLTNEIMAEYRNVLSRPKFDIRLERLAFWLERLAFWLERLAFWLERLNREGKFASDVPPLDFPRDRNDAKFLALARFVGAEYLITGDADFSDVPEGMLPQTRIVSASEFCRSVELL
jgi:uncharacterized protein